MLVEQQSSRVNRSQRQFFMLCILTCVCSLIYWANVSSTEREEEMMISSSAVGLSLCWLGSMVKNESDLSRNLTVPKNKASILTKVQNTMNKSKRLLEIVVWPISQFVDATKNRLPKNAKEMEKAGCRLKLSRNQEDVDRADAVWFYLFWVGFKREELPRKTRSDQIWISYQRESAPWQTGPQLDGLFNWTISYRKDSDFFDPYFEKYPKKPVIPKSSPIRIGHKQLALDKFIQGKSKLAVAVISHCNARSGRDQIIKTLQSVNVSIDVFGKCGKPMKESRKNFHSDSEAFQELAKDYKFFLGFENSICTDYITEKFWRSLEIGMVPVVLGRGDYLTDAPPNSFIDIRDYPDPIDLRNYLHRLNGNNTEYSKYFEWRRGFNIRSKMVSHSQICQRLKKRLKQCEGICKPQVYSDFNVWWKNEPGKTDSPSCVPPQNIGLGKYIME